MSGRFVRASPIVTGIVKHHFTRCGPMDVERILIELEARANDKVRARNAKLGAGSNQFGVMLGDIRKLAKQSKADHALGLALWETGNLEARLLATLVVKPKRLSGGELEAMVESASFAQLADWLNAYVVPKHPEHEALREKWLRAGDAWLARAAWSLTARRVEEDAEGLDLPALLDRIEVEMAGAPPEAQWTMNTTLAQIGIHFPEHRKRAIDIGERLGIYRDFPVPKGCTSPFAPLWISEIVRRQADGNSSM